MKRILTIVFVLSLVATSAFAQEDYGWSISNSNTDPDQNTGAAAAGIFDLFLWLNCTGSAGGWSAMEANVQATGISLIGNPVPLNGVLNAGSGALLQLGVGGCPVDPFLAVQFTFFDPAGAGGDVCLIDSSGPDNWNVTVDCDPVNAQAFPNAVIGYSSTGADPCLVGDCGTVSIEDESWGSIKGLYR